MNKYVGHPSQISGAEEVVLAKGKGKGMTLINIRNGKGLNVTLSPDRCMDISRVSFKGENIGFFAPCGYVSPQFYDGKDNGFLKSFTAGFMTTCGLAAVGSPCVDNGEELPLHGNISNTPCEQYSYYETDFGITVNAVVRDAALFNNSYVINRKYEILKGENKINIEDRIVNEGNKPAPCMILYHINFGYPMLSENAQVFIPADSVKPRNLHAEEFMDFRLNMEKPQRGYEECCYYYDVKAEGGTASVGIYSHDIKKGVKLSFDKKTLNCFTEWKMMGENEYALGLEPANCTPDGRDVMRKKNMLKTLEPGEEYKTSLQIEFSENMEDIQCL